MHIPVYILQIMLLNIHVVCTIVKKHTNSYSMIISIITNFNEINSLCSMPFPHMYKEIRCEKGWGKESRGIARGCSGGSSTPRADKSPALARDFPLYWDKLPHSRLGLNISR